MRWTLVRFLVVSLSLCFGPSRATRAEEPKRPSRVILVIGDGMGVSQISAGRFAKGGPLSWERADVYGYQITCSADNIVTDSAAAATALATGVKTDNGAIGVDTKERPVRSVLEIAEAQGKWTGLVATSSITHATPAGFAAHVAKRSQERDIARQMAAMEIEVLLGGGAQFFLPASKAEAEPEDEDGAKPAAETEKKEDAAKTEETEKKAADPDAEINLIEVMHAKGYDVLRTDDDLAAFDPASSDRVLGLFSEVGMPTAKKKRTPTLRAMTEKALALLDRGPKGFFLLVEGSQIDWRCHENTVSGMIAEVLDLSDTVDAILSYADAHPGTLVVITADHETGGFAVAGGDRAKRKVTGAWTSKSHTATMVPVFAHGVGASMFRGVLENTDIGIRLIGLISEPMPSGG
ncbi:MAG: alkaline phosphatase [Planctomycetes bacterium]|nr:alkaline phosphatase [Planctomycetota bacterium]